MKDVWVLVREYRERFSYPFRWLSNLTDAEHIETIEKCLSSGIPINPQYEPDKDY